MTRQQVLTPIEEGSLLGTAHADPNSIMCYQIPGTITKSGQPIIGGTDIDPSDFAFMATIYPKLTRGSEQAPKQKAKKRRQLAGVGARKQGNGNGTVRSRKRDYHRRAK